MSSNKYREKCTQHPAVQTKKLLTVPKIRPSLSEPNSFQLFVAEFIDSDQ